MNTYGFTLIKEELVVETGGIAKFFKHDKTGAQFLSVTNDDNNKCFAVNFRTPPKNSTGVAHILEHSVLCGSEKYPVKEPFMQLLKSSLKTFLNAMTYPDKTCYPVASTNTQDLYNLMDVYMDAVFFPRVRTPQGRDVFAQEGWHIDTSSEKWKFKGVVYNEMKGAYSSPDTTLNEHAQKNIFPDTLYRYSSGGDPAHILDLSYEEFEEFHKQYYHPSNAYFFAWGDDDEEMRLKKIDEVISHFDKIDVTSAVPLQSTFDNPKKVEATFSVSKTDPKKSGHALISWLLPTVYEKDINLLFQVLDNILMGLPGAPLKKALIDSGLGEDVRGGLNDSLRQMTYSVGLRAIQLGKEEEMQKIIFDTLTEIVNIGIPKINIDAAINTIEFRKREGAFHIFSKGLMSMLQSLTHWLHDEDPIEALKWKESVSNIKSRIANGEKVFENLIQTYLLENKHRVLVNLMPSSELADEKLAIEEARMQAIYDSLSEEERKKVVSESERIQASQAKEDSEEALATIPVLSLSDIPPKETELPIYKEDANFNCYAHAIKTNDILYSKLLCSLENLPQHLLQYIPLYSRALTEIGTAHSNFTELGLNIGAYTGGVRANTYIHESLKSENGTKMLAITARATKENITKLCSLLDEIIFSVNFDNQERFNQMLLEEKAKVERMLIPSGRTFATTRLDARFSQIGVLTETMQGVSYVQFVQNIAKEINSNWEIVLKNFQTIHNYLFRKDNITLDITGDEEIIAQAKQEFSTLLSKLENNDNLTKHDWSYNYLDKNEAFIVPSQVNYIAMGSNLYKHGYTFSGSALVINRYLRIGYLWDNIRILGGAYGCGLLFSKATGTFTYASYRDPQVEKSLFAFKKTAEYLGNLHISEKDLNNIIIGTVGDLDPYLQPEGKAATALSRELSGDTLELRQKMRDEVFSTKLSDFHDFATPLQKAIDSANFVCFGGTSLEEYAKTNNWEITKLL